MRIDIANWFRLGLIVLLLMILSFLVGVITTTPDIPPKEVGYFNVVVQTNDFMGNKYYLAFPK